MEEIIAKAKGLILSGRSEEALSFLAPNYPENLRNVQFSQVYAESLLENNVLEEAYEVLVETCELDPQGDQGVEKFLYLGQMIGGFDGLKYLNIALDKLNLQLNKVNEDKGEDDESLVRLSKVYGNKEKLQSYLKKMINKGIFAEIEIWMTDLCMEPEAESKCNELITVALNLDNKNPETLSLLSSIRISQQRVEEAVEALQESWRLFQQKKQQLMEAANSQKQSEEDQGEESDIGLEYIDLIQPLLSLSRFAIELELYDLAIEIASNTQDINEIILEPFYYQALANILEAKRIVSNENNSKSPQDYRDLEIDQLNISKLASVASHLEEARSALTQGYKIIHSDSADADNDLIDQVSQLLNCLGGPVQSELMPPKRHEKDEEEDWENEIESTDEL